MSAELSHPSTILVTGGAGFIGSHLVDILMLRSDATVIVADNFHTGNKANLARWEGNPRLRIVKHNIREPFACSTTISQIYHLACPASPPAYQSDPRKTLETCFLGTKHVFDLAVRHRARVLIASTSEVYGDPKEHPQSESYHGNVNPYGPRACYDEGKRVAEALTWAAQHPPNGQAPADVRIARIFNTYGPRMGADDGRVVSSFIKAALGGGELAIYGDGAYTRSFCYVEDMVMGLQRLMESSYDRGPVNLGNNEETSILGLAELVIDVVNMIEPPTSTQSLRVVSRAPRTDDPQTRKPDISLAEEVLNWKPKISLPSDLARTVEWMSADMATSRSSPPTSPESSILSSATLVDDDIPKSHSLFLAWQPPTVGKQLHDGREAPVDESSSKRTRLIWPDHLQDPITDQLPRHTDH